MDIDLAALVNGNPDVLQYLANSPVTSPPPGKVSNFKNPASQAPLQVWVTGTLLALAVFLFANRVYIKVRLMRTWSWDDVTLTIAMILGIGEFSLKSYGVIKGLMGRHLYDIPLLRYLQPDVPIFYYAVLVTQSWILLFLKATFFLLYLHLFGRVRWVRISSWIGLVFVVLAHSAVGIFCFAVANPRESLSWGLSAYNMSLALGGIGLVADIAIFVIPYIAIAPLQLSSAKKWGAGIIFLTGGCAVICSIFNLYYRSQLRYSKDYSWDGIPANIFALAESLIGIICACIPTLAFGFRYTGSVYQRAFCLSAFVDSRAPSQYPEKSGSQKKKEVELTSITSKSHIYSKQTSSTTDLRNSMPNQRSSESLDMVIAPARDSVGGVEIELQRPESVVLPTEGR